MKKKSVSAHCAASMCVKGSRMKFSMGALTWVPEYHVNATLRHLAPSSCNFFHTHLVSSNSLIQIEAADSCTLRSSYQRRVVNPQLLRHSNFNYREGNERGSSFVLKTRISFIRS